MVISSVFTGVAMVAFSLQSPNFKSQDPIPTKYSCKGSDISPELVWKDAPQNSKSFALTIVDPDAPGGNFIHWIIYNIPATVKYLPTNLAKDPVLDNGMMQGKNDFGSIGYGGPCPPPSQTHNYIFTLYALDSILSLQPGVSYPELQSAIKGHVLGEATLIGQFSN